MHDDDYYIKNNSVITIGVRNIISNEYGNNNIIIIILCSGGIIKLFYLTCASSHD